MQDSDEDELGDLEERKSSTIGSQDEEEARQEIAPVPDNLLNFEDEVERVLQAFLEAEH